MKRPYEDGNYSDDDAVIEQIPKNKSLLEKKRKRLKEKKHRKDEQKIIDEIVTKYESLDQEAASNFTSFDQFPLSEQTLKGLENGGFTKPTAIQKQSLGYSIVGQDVVGAAKTGSGKTLALLIPLLECLWRNRWTKFDGLGGLIICPTRELAFQIFQVLNTIGAHHEFSAALLIGGTNVEYERKRLAPVNIVICTPGRLLQHMDENENFSSDNLLMLIIDEADRILDMGFKREVDAIIENLPKERQTLLFSATQTRKVEDLVRISLNDPVFISVHEHSKKATPDQLVQSYIVCEEEDKINLLWSFLANHKRKKTLMFVTCCKQARFLTESLRHLRPGFSLMGLWGGQKQTKRMEIFSKFDRNFRGAAMIATDVASRGLDFQRVDWVVQLDCPADVDDYIHRVGRTARMDKKGEAVLVLTPSQEKPFTEMLAKRHVPISKVSVDTERLVDIRQKLSNLMIPFPQLQHFAQGSFVAYARALYFMKLKEVFNVDSINLEALASSYGLAVTPRIRFLRKQQKQESVKEGSDEEDEYSEKDNIAHKMNGFDAAVNSEEDNSESDDEFLKVARRDVFNSLEEATSKDEITARIPTNKVSTAKEIAKKILKKRLKVNSKVKFNDINEEQD
ncbi:DEAD/DEAH box helicase domain-containing protein [Ditylenchus destructor]|nr:DEAD/DEAH box helicase domain-containing protein [Ditylenchus destructor]